MAIDTNQLSSDLEYVIDDLPAEATAKDLFNGTVSVTLSELSVDSTLMLAGNIDIRLYELVVPLSRCIAVPATQMRIAITGQGETAPTNYQVDTWKKSQDGIAYHIILKADHRV